MLNLVDGLYRYDQPGFNQLENEFYYQYVISNEGQLIEYQELAEKIAESKGIKVDQVYEKFLGASDNTADAVSFFGSFFVDVQLLRSKQLSSERNRPFLIAEMMLRSRLQPFWVSANLAELTEDYGTVFSPEELELVSRLHRADWLSDSIREKALKRLVSVLPKQQVRLLNEFAENELLEGAKPEIKLPAEMSEVLGKHASEGTKPMRLAKTWPIIADPPTSELEDSA